MGPGPRPAYLAAEGYLPNGNGRLPSQAMAPSFMLRCEALVAADEDGAGAGNHWLPSIQAVAAPTSGSRPCPPVLACTSTQPMTDLVAAASG